MRRLARPELLRPLGLVAVIGAAIAVAAVIGVPGIGGLRAHYAGTGMLGLLLFSGLYAGLSLLPLPLSVVTIAAGAVFGLGRGGPAVVLGATVGAVLAFWLGRVLGRDTVQRLAGRRLDSFDALLQRRGLPAVLVVRLVPVLPFTAVNYLSGLTAVRFPTYLAGTVLGIVPGTVAYVAIGAYGHRPGSWPFLVAVGSLLALTIAGVLTQRARRRRARCGSAAATLAADPLSG
ncbi:MAG: VTT domain-containing protein [Pseudonocardiales bacterium]